MTGWFRTAVAAAIVLLLAQSVAAAQRYDPRLRFRTLRTPHFDIYFHQGEAALAVRLARIAEDVSQEIEARLGRPSGRIRVILVDQSDLANGWATPVPYDLIEIQAVPPRADSTIGNTDDWLRLVFSHEYTHIVHLDRTRGWIGGLRYVFGRLPVLYPNIFLPQWQIEGLATYEESAVTGQGRVPAGDFRMLLDRAASDGRFLPLDRASGGLLDWPSGTAPYLYGAYFHQYLAERFGPEKLAALANDTSGRIPYLGTRAFKKIFGQSLGDLWKAFEADRASRAVEEITARTRLTSHGFTVRAPRFGTSGELYYSIANAHGFPALMRLDPDGRSRQVTTRYLGTQTAVTGDLLVFDQLEIVRNVGLQSDLYAMSRAGGAAWRLTHEARAADPDVAPDGRTIACTIQYSGRRVLATMAMPAEGQIGRPTPLLSDEMTEWSAPRWSPDGTTIVAERRQLGGPSEIVLVNVATRAVEPIVSSPTGRNVTPEWTRDGRAVLFASDRGGRSFEIYRLWIDSRQVERLSAAGAGAQSPTISPDGRTLVFVGYTIDGYDLFSLPYETTQWTPVAAGVPTVRTPAVAPQRDAAPAASAYSPWATARPTFWLPTVATDEGELVAGAATGSSDALGRHTYFASAAWSAARARPDWSVAYAYDRWWPTLFADYSDDTDPWREGEVRSREANAGVFLPWVHVRWNQAALVAWHASTDAFDCAACSPTVDANFNRRAARVGWTFSNAKTYGYSITAEEGARVAATSEFTRRGLGADGDATAVTLEARTYVRAWPRHAAIAARVGWASSWGDQSARRLFSAGGSGPVVGGFGFGSDAIGLLRGFDEAAIVGPRAVVANLDYRFPIARIQRGSGTLPVFLRTIHGAVFADAGHAWDRHFRSADLSRSIGAELSTDVVLGYALPLTFTTGAAWRDGPVRRDVTAFARIGRAF